MLFEGCQSLDITIIYLEVNAHQVPGCLMVTFWVIPYITKRISPPASCFTSVPSNWWSVALFKVNQRFQRHRLYSPGTEIFCTSTDAHDHNWCCFPYAQHGCFLQPCTLIIFPLSLLPYQSVSTTIAISCQWCLIKPRLFSVCGSVRIWLGQSNAIILLLTTWWRSYRVIERFVTLFDSKVWCAIFGTKFPVYMQYLYQCCHTSLCIQVVRGLSITNDMAHSLILLIIVYCTWLGHLPSTCCSCSSWWAVFVSSFC